MNSNTVDTVSARELHTFLEVQTRFNDWIAARINKYEFIENQDFVSFTEFSVKPKGGRPSREYYITLDMAKEFANWIKSRIADFGFIENQDFIKLHKKMELSKTGQTYKIIRKY